MAQSISPIRGADLESLLSRRGSAVDPTKSGNPATSERLISFIYGFPDGDSLPSQQVADATIQALEKNGRHALQYGAASGAPPLVDALIAKLARDQGIQVSPEQMVVTAGGTQAVNLMLDVFVDWGDTVVVEAPSWMGFLWALNNVGGKSAAVPVDADGMDTDALEQTLKSLKQDGVTPKFIYVMTNFQNPSGVTMSLDRRHRLIELANEYETFILEDDAYHDLRYRNDRLPAIFSLDTTGSTLYTATLSKIMGAGMRLGWLLGPEEIISRISTMKFDGGTNVFGAYVAAEWLPDHLESHLATLKDIYSTRRESMLNALERRMPEGSTWTNPDGGFFIWLTLPEGIDAAAMLPQARERGVDYLPGATCYGDGSGKNQIRLSFSFADEDDIETGIEILADVARAELLESGDAAAS